MGNKYYAAIAGVLIGCGPKPTTNTADVTPAVTMALAVPATPTPLLDTVTKSIAISAPHLSEGRRKLLAGMLTHIAGEVFDSRTHQDFWVALVGVESRYEGTARSPAGAVGLGQLLPKFATGFAQSCGLPEITAADVGDDYTNAYISACVFKGLIAANDGSITLAMVGYNAGQASKSMVNVKRGGNPVEETSGYVTRIHAKQEQNGATK